MCTRAENITLNYPWLPYTNIWENHNFNGFSVTKSSMPVYPPNFLIIIASCFVFEPKNYHRLPYSAQHTHSYTSTETIANILIPHFKVLIPKAKFSRPILIFTFTPLITRGSHRDMTCNFMDIFIPDPQYHCIATSPFTTRNQEIYTIKKDRSSE